MTNEPDSQLMQEDSSKEHGSITQAIHNLDGDENQQEIAIEILWSRFFERLCRLANTRIPVQHKKAIDPEDIASRVFYKLIENIKQNRYQAIKGRDNFWALLTTYAVRNVISRSRFEDAQKRGPGQNKRVLNEQELESVGIGNLTYFVESHDESDFDCLDSALQHLLDLLPSQAYKDIVLAKMDGMPVDLIALKFNCSTRTVQRRLETARALWEKSQTD